MDVKFWGTRGSIPTPLSAEAIKNKIRAALEGAAGLDLTDPASSDEKIWAGKEQAEAYLMRRHPNYTGCEVIVAYDGLTLEI